MRFAVKIGNCNRLLKFEELKRLGLMNKVKFRSLC